MTVCSLPWIHLATHPEGKATLCCISNHTKNMSAARTNNRVLNLNSNSVIEIVNSDFYKKTRLEMLAGVKPQACSRCYEEETLTGTSKRLLENSRFTVDYTTMTDGSIVPDLKFIELRLGNLCNVKCRTCNPASSTQWITEYSKMQTALPFITQYTDKVNADWTQSDTFWSELFEHSKNLELIYINGGEPTLVEKHWNYLERLIDAGLNSQVKLWYSINMTNLPDKLLSIWKEFKEVEIHASIDDLYGRNEYIRKGTKWSSVEENIAKLQDNNWIDFSVTQTVSWMNIFYLEEFKNYFEQRGIRLQHNLVHDPKFYSISILPNNIKKELEQVLPNHKNLLNQVSSNINIDLLRQGMKYNQWLDTSRNESFDQTFPEWNKILSLC